MTFLQSVGEFFLTQWLWSVTWGLYHAPVACLIMFLLAKFYMRMNVAPAALLSIIANIFSFLVYTLLVVGILIYALNFQFAASQSELKVYQPLILAGIYLGLIYTVLQAILFLCINQRYALNVRNLIVISFVSNMIAAVVVNLFLPSGM